MAFSNTFDSLSNAIIPQDIPVELIIDNHGVIINPNQGSYFYLDDIDENLNITLTNPTNSYCRTVYLRLSFEDDNIVMNWPSNIKWQVLSSPFISQYEDILISLTTLDGGVTWYGESLVKTKPIVDCTFYMFSNYPIDECINLTQLPLSVEKYMESIRPSSLYGFFMPDWNKFFYTWNTMRCGITSLDLTAWDVSLCINAECCFESCCLERLNISNWDTKNLKSM